MADEGENSIITMWGEIKTVESGAVAPFKQ